jgi:tRNA A-37 threonylcarbamoyl transferase component Bud32
MNQGGQPEDCEPDEPIGCPDHGSEMPNPPVSASDPESCDVNSLDDVSESKVREREEDLERIFGKSPGTPKTQTSSSEDTPKMVISKGQGIDSHQPLDRQSVTRAKLLKGGWVTLGFFLSYTVWNGLASPPKTLIEICILFAAILAAVWAIGCLIYLHKETQCSLKNMDLLVYSLLIVTLIFLMLYHVNKLIVYQRNIPAAIILPFFAVVVAYGIFVPDPNPRSKPLAWLLHFVAFCPLLVTAIFAISQDTLRHFSVPLGEMAIWLLLGRCIAYLGPYQFDQLESDPYVRGEMIGSGGMGEVYLAKDRFRKQWFAYKNRKEWFAYKKMKAEGVDKPTLLERFRREARALGPLIHRNIIEVYDFGQTSNGVPYYTMEYVPGSNMQELVHNHGPLPPGRAVYLLRQVCQALRYVHTHGLIHRDIKPANIMISRPSETDEVAKVLDFGLARNVMDSSTPELTKIGEILGTPEYMPPEQARGDPDLDKRIDIYSLGGVAYFLLTGSPPFANERAHAYKPVVRPSVHRPGIPSDLEAVILKCLEESPHERYEDATSMEKALAACECVNDWDEAAMAEWWKQNPARDLRPKADATPPVAD